MSATVLTSHREFTSDIAFTPAVKIIQEQKGSRKNYSRMERSGGWQAAVTPHLTEFLAHLDMFYLGTANGEGQPPSRSAPLGRPVHVEPRGESSGPRSTSRSVRSCTPRSSRRVTVLVETPITPVDSSSVSP